MVNVSIERMKITTFLQTKFKRSLTSYPYISYPNHRKIIYIKILIGLEQCILRKYPYVYKKLDSPRPNETERALFQNLRNLLLKKQKIGRFSSNLTRKLPKKKYKNWETSSPYRGKFKELEDYPNLKFSYKKPCTLKVLQVPVPTNPPRICEICKTQTCGRTTIRQTFSSIAPKWSVRPCL